MKIEARSALAIAACVLALRAAPVRAQSELDFLFSDEPAEEESASEQPAAEPSPRPAPAPAAPERAEAPAEKPPPAAAPEPLPEPERPVVAAPIPSPAPAKPSRKVVEEIVVTAQKREQFIQDVPISMTVLDSEFIAEQGVTDVREALLFVPNAKVEVAGFFAAPRIRGFSFNNNNKAFEPPAGLALDGVPYTRIGYFAAALFDVARLEVLRGPQGTTFGKNTTAGVISVISKDPTDELEGFADFQLGDQGRRRIELGVGGPIVSDFVNFRLSGLSDEADGFVRNTTAAVSPIASARLRGKDRTGFRGKIGFPSLFGTDLVLTYEQVELQDGGAGLEMYHVGSEFESVVRRYDPNADLVKGNFIASIDYRDFRNTEIRTIQADWGTEVLGWGVDLIAAHSVYEEFVELDTDFTPAPGLIGTSIDTSPTTTVELRTLSPMIRGLFGLERLFGFDFGQSDLLVGFFFQRRPIEDSLFRFVFDDGPFLELTVAAASDSGQTVTLPPGTSVNDSGVLEDVMQFFEQEGETYAGFAQAQWFFLPQWTLQYGMRISQENKSASWNQVFATANQAVLLAAGLREFTAEHEISELQFQPKVSLNYQPLDDVSLFAHWAQAFKSGGFNAFAFRGENVDELVYGPESVEEWGLDAKTTLFGGLARWNTSLYWMNVSDFQVLTRIPEDTTIGLGVTSTVNAEKARARGVESDLTWIATPWLTVIGTMGLNDTRYLDFPLNECPADRQDPEDGDEDPRCDATGRPFFAAPQWSNTATTLFRSPLTSIPGIGGTLPSFLGGVDWTAGFTAEYTDVFYPDVDLDFRKRQKSFFRYRASAGFGDYTRGWSFRVTGENLTNEATSIREGDLFAGVFVAATEPSRTIYGSFRWEF